LAAFTVGDGRSLGLADPRAGENGPKGARFCVELGVAE
jgi:hypothetical protein